MEELKNQLVDVERREKEARDELQRETGEKVAKLEMELRRQRERAERALEEKEEELTVTR